MAGSLVFLSKENIPLTTSQIIADALDKDHHSVIQLVRNHEKELCSFGRVAYKSLEKSIEEFQIPRGAIKEKVIAYLNESQATLLITMMRNTEKVIRFKVVLVKAFFEMKKALSAESGFYTPDEIAEIKDRALKQGYAIAMNKKSKEEAPQIPEGGMVLSAYEAQALRNVVKMQRYFKPRLLEIYRHLSALKDLTGLAYDSAVEPVISLAVLENKVN